METWIDDKVLYEGSVFRLRAGAVRLADGGVGQREVIEHPGGVCIVPFDGECVTLVRQYRIAIGESILEAPAGKLEGDEDPAARGAAELEEEAGYRAGRLIPAGFVYATVGYCSEKIHLYLALALTEVGQRLEPEEDIAIVRLPIDEVRAGLREGRFTDAKTVVGLHRLMAWLGEHPECMTT